MVLVRYADQGDDLLYKAFVRYEQLKIFVAKSLDYQREIFSAPMGDFKRHLGQIQRQMQAEEESTGLFDDALMTVAAAPQKAAPVSNSGNMIHLKTEMAFTFIKEHETVEKKYA